MKYFEKIKGDRIYLSPIRIEDAELYVEWLNDKDISDNLAKHSKVTTLEGEKAWIQKHADDYIFGIVLKEKNRLIGNVGLTEVDLIGRSATLGIFIGDKNEQNKGYGREAIKIILNYGFNTLNLNNIMLGVLSFNEKAIKTYKKVGFKTFGVRKSCVYKDGLFYDYIYMQILKDQFNEIEDFIYIP